MDEKSLGPKGFDRKVWRKRVLDETDWTKRVGRTGLDEKGWTRRVGQKVLDGKGLG